MRVLEWQRCLPASRDCGCVEGASGLGWEAGGHLLWRRGQRRKRCPCGIGLFPWEVSMCPQECLVASGLTSLCAAPKGSSFPKPSVGISSAHDTRLPEAGARGRVLAQSWMWVQWCCQRERMEMDSDKLYLKTSQRLEFWDLDGFTIWLLWADGDKMWFTIVFSDHPAPL